VNRGSAPAEARPGAAAAVPWLLGGAFILVFFVRDFLGSEGGLIHNSAVFWGRDFVNVWTGGRLVGEGRLELIYDVEAYGAYQRALFGAIGPHNYSYPPVSFPLAWLAALLPYPVALAAWMAATGALFVHAARPWWPQRAGPAWLAVLTPAAILNIWAGHYGFLIGALFLLGWQNLEERPRVAGIFFGLMLLKPHLAILVPPLLLVRGHWQAIGSAAATVAVLVSATTLAFGWQAWDDWLFRTSGVQAAMIDPGEAFFGWMSASTATAALRLGASWPVAIAAHLVVAGMAAAMVARAAIRDVPTRELALLAATATFLILPYSFNYDMTVVMIGALSLLAARGLTAAEERMAVYGFLAPQIGMILAGFGYPLMPVMLLGLAYAQMRVACRKAEGKIASAH
jgi:alpha-1,2-mannosyltransferase